jgi:hypothetical protein
MQVNSTEAELRSVRFLSISSKNCVEVSRGYRVMLIWSSFAESSGINATCLCSSLHYASSSSPTQPSVIMHIMFKSRMICCT